MKKYSSIISIVLIVAIGYFTQGFTPWWSISLIALIIALLFQLNPSKGALAGFLAGLILWGGMAFIQSMANQGLLAERIGMMLGGVPGPIVPLLSGLIGGITASLGALLGSLGRSMLRAS
jgi:hypothetical protein